MLLLAHDMEEDEDDFEEPTPVDFNVENVIAEEQLQVPDKMHSLEPMMELLHWHYRLGHLVPFKNLQEMVKRKLLPSS